MTQLLLEAGADPNDGESLYHSLEDPDCTRLLLQHGARVTGTTALRRALDMPDPGALELLLAHGGDPNEPASGPPADFWGAPLLRAIAVRRSAQHVEALPAAGADPSACTRDGISAYRLALQAGLPEIADLLRAAGAAEPLSEDEQFVAACARADVAEARRILAMRPDLPASLPRPQLRLLPDTVAWGSESRMQGNPHVRFDEGDVETQLWSSHQGTARRKGWKPTCPAYRHRATSRLYPTGPVGGPANPLRPGISGPISTGSVVSAAQAIVSSGAGGSPPLRRISRSKAVKPAAGSLLVPAMVAAEGERAAFRFIDFFTANIRNPNTRAA
jgi:hypothetical protein